MALTKVTGQVVKTDTDLTVGVITAVTATFTGNVSVAGTLTYDDVTNVDSVGLITARSGIDITGGGGLNLTGGAGVVTATTYRVGTASTLDASGLSVSAGVVTATTYRVGSGSTAAPSITPTDDTNTGIFFPSADTIAFGEGGSEAARIDSSGRLLLGTSSNISGQGLQVVSGAGANHLGLFKFANNDDGGELTFGNSRNDTIGSHTIVNNGDFLGRIFFRGSDGSAFLRGADIVCQVDGTPGANDMPGRLVFSTTADGQSSPTERMRIDSSGRLGIGTSSPSTLIHGVVSSGTAALRLENTANSGESSLQLFGKNSGGTVRSANIKYDNADYFRIGTTAAVALAFETSDVERMRITSAGNVGIGTASPGSLLHHAGNANSAQFDSSTGVYLTFKYNGTAIGYIGSANHVYTGGGIGNVAIAGGAGSSITFATTDTERARIDSSGRLLVGTSTGSDNIMLHVVKSGTVNTRVESSSFANTNVCSHSAFAGNRLAEIGLYKHSGITNAGAFIRLDEEDGTISFLWVDNSGNLRIGSNVNFVGTTSGTVVGTQTSDERIKNILGPVEYGLDTIKQIEPIRYALKAEPDTEKLGFIAQQVQPLIPQSVFDTNEHIEGEPEDAPTKLGMEYVALIPVLVNAIKELSAEVDALKAQLS